MTATAALLADIERTEHILDGHEPDPATAPAEPCAVTTDDEATAFFFVC
ncbi:MULTISPECIES: hypothetical protein [Streptomyces]|uniref:Uncharacterized protein n=2 Tax=Streptomyces TaxID=1883 RepID=A0ABV9J2I0_9ACTN